MDDFIKPYRSLYDRLEDDEYEPLKPPEPPKEKEIPITLYKALTPESDLDNHWKVNDHPAGDFNSTVKDESIGSTNHEIAKDIFRSYARDKLYNYLQKEYGQKEAFMIMHACDSGQLKVHDLHNIDMPYCYSFSVRPIVEKGLPFLSFYNAKKPRTVQDYVESVIHFVGYASKQLTGAISLPDFFVYFDWFARRQYENSYDNFDIEDIHALFKHFIQEMNYEYRINQSPFTNLNIYDHDFLEYLFKDIIYPDDTTPVIESIEVLQQCYVDWITNEAKRNIFTFPIHTACFHTQIKNKRRLICDTEFLDYISEKNCRSGFFNIYTGDLTSMSSCCRLRSDLSKLYQNSFGAGGVSIGSHRVVTLNLPLIALTAGTNKDGTFDMLLNSYLDKAIKILKAHRAIIQDNINCHLLPLYDLGFMELDKQYSTVGFIGLYECCEFLRGHMGYLKYAESVLEKINNRLSQEIMFNLEQIPGETTASELLQKIKKIYPQYDNGSTVLSNQFIPLTMNMDVLDRIEAQGIFDKMVNGGSVAHLNMSEPLTKDQMKKLIEFAAYKGCIYFAFNMNLAYCKNCKIITVGQPKQCPNCAKSDFEDYTRVVGFLTPVSRWTDERIAEYDNRKFFAQSDTFKMDETTRNKPKRYIKYTDEFKNPEI